MGLDQTIWADVQINGEKKQVAIHYWRKDYQIDEWFFSRLAEDARNEIKLRGESVWSCPITPGDLALLEADNYALAFRLGFDLNLLSRCRWAWDEGFTLTYCSSH